MSIKTNALIFMLTGVFCLTPEPVKAEDVQGAVGKKRLVVAAYLHGFSADHHPLGLPSRQNDIRGRVPYDQVVSSDASVASRWDIEQAKAAGVDSFAIWMYPRMGDPLLGKHAGTFKGRARVEALLTEMQNQGGITFYPDYWWYRMSPENWVKTDKNWISRPMPDIEAEMRRQGEMLRDWSQRFGNVWARRDGRLLVGMQDHSLFANVPYKKAMEWLFGPLGGRDKIYLALSRYPTSGVIAKDWLEGADAVFDWDANRSYGDSRIEYAAGKKFADSHSKNWWTSFAPGFSQSRYRDATAPKIPTVYERLGVIAFRRAWLDAIKDEASVVYLITWNDVTEDSEIMPTAAHGYAIQRLNRFFSRWFHGKKIPRIEREELLLFHHPQVVKGLELPAGRMVSVSPDWCRTPPTDYVTLCSFLFKPADVSIFFQRKCIAQQRLPAGFHTWLLYHPNQMPAGTSKGTVAIYPQEEKGLSITRLSDSFADMELSVRICRDGIELGRYFSHRPVVSAAGRADLGTVGDVFVIKP